MKPFHELFAEIIDKHVGREDGKQFRNYAELAEKASVSPTAISQYKHGKTEEPRISVLDRLSAALGYEKSHLRNIWISCIEGSSPQSLEVRETSTDYEDLSPTKKRFMELFDQLDDIDQEAMLKRMERMVDGDGT